MLHVVSLAFQAQERRCRGCARRAVDSADEVGAQAQLPADGKPLEAVDDLAVLVLNDGRVDGLRAGHHLPWRPRAALPCVWWGPGRQARSSRTSGATLPALARVSPSIPSRNIAGNRKPPP